MGDTEQGSNLVTPEKMMKVSEVAKIFDVEPATVREWLKDGDLRGNKIGKGHYWRVPESAVMELVNKKYGSESQHE